MALPMRVLSAIPPTLPPFKSGESTTAGAVDLPHFIVLRQVLLI